MSKLTEIMKKFIDECWKANYDSQCLVECLSENCFHHKTIGKCSGVDTFQCDCDDWSNAFPDYGTHILNITEYPHLVIADVMRFGTHQNRYRSTNKKKETILNPSPFFSGIEQLEPTGIRYYQPAKVICTFEKEKITQVIIDENPDGMCIALGIPTSSADDNSTQTFPIDYDLVRNAVQSLWNVDLTKRELQAVSLSFCSFTAKHIAELLRISHRTVEKFIESAYYKFGITSKQHLLEMMYENYLITLWLDLGNELLSHCIKKKEHFDGCPTDI